MGETMTMQTSDTLGKFATAMAKAQSMMGGATKGSRNPHFNSAFADLASVVNAVKGPLSTNGIAFVQMPSSTGDLVSVTTRLVHSSGEWMQCTLSARPRKNDPQGVGSVVTYLKRYTLQAMCGVPSEDATTATRGAKGLSASRSGVPSPGRTSTAAQRSPPSKRRGASTTTAPLPTGRSPWAST